VLAIAPSGYTGVSTATGRLFPVTVDVGVADLVFASDRRRLVEAVRRTRAGQIVFSGWVEGYESLVRDLRRRGEAPWVGVLWHGSPMQLADRDERRQYDRVTALAREGVVDRLGFFKSGEGEAHARRGLPAIDVFNPPPDGAPRTVVPQDAGEDAPLRLGLFAAGVSWRKNPYAMLAAAGRLEGVALTGVLDAAAQAYARALGVAMEHVLAEPFDRPSLAKHIAAQHCNLYVTLSECSPLLPLESLHAGVPCLIGPSSHLFSGTPVRNEREAEVIEAARLLEDRLVVSRADDPRAIAAAIRIAVDDRAAILDAYAKWVPAFAAVAHASIDAFLLRSPGAAN